ncbi:hypothetical protein BCR35DRAFT_310006 [Leucosporidium creatinivorum]|uniref:DUF1014-domain-containing protein n=1 Tax=Leucosporidium creatinivorum TaxID=106004 RepID=A0A1Y2D904_9BASI|nr:hypothetical protein BCR35DRAFT_310006 [Leucosporidium creatinivorum]
MPPNAKQVAGRARKAEAAEGKKNAEKAVKAKEEDAEWAKGAKGKDKGADKAAAAEEARRKKAERERLLAEEESSMPSKPKANPKAGAKKAAPVKSTPKIPSFESGFSDDPQSFSASGIDDALDMLNLVGSRSDKAAIGSQAAKIETHPERRYKAAFEAYKEDALPQLKKDFPGLRLQQYNERLFLAFKKHPDNPFNQVSLSYDATKADKVAALQAQKDEIARRLRDD